MAAAMLVIVVIIVIMIMVMIVIVMAVMMFMLVVVLIFVVVMVVVVMMMIVLCRFFEQLFQLVIYSILLRHSIGKLLSGELIPFCRYYRSLRVLLAQALYAVVELFL